MKIKINKKDILNMILLSSAYILGYIVGVILK